MSLVVFLKESAVPSTWISNIIKQRDPAWIMALPLMHFLDESLQPFGQLDYDNFQDKLDSWWLTNEFKKEKNDLKRYPWTR